MRTSLLLLTSLLVGVVFAASVGKQKREPSHVETAEVKYHPATGAIHKMELSKVFGRKRESSSDSILEATVRAFLLATPELGISRPHEELRFQRTIVDRLKKGHFQREYQQLYQGLEVEGAILKVYFNHESQIFRVRSTLINDLSLDTTPELSAEKALSLLNEDSVKGAVVDKVFVYRTGLSSGRRGTNYLAFFIRVTQGSQIGDVIMDANNGEILSSRQDKQHALVREVYEGVDTNLAWSEGDPEPSDPDIADAILWASQYYNMMANSFQIDSFDQNGITMRTILNIPNFGPDGSTVCPNAFFSSNDDQISVCPGLLMQDIVYHEWGHAYTSYSSMLEYEFESGALNEAISDITAEVLQLTLKPQPLRTLDVCIDNSAQDQDRWLLAEGKQFGTDGLYSLRDLWEPTCSSQPDWTGSPFFDCISTVSTPQNDNGGVHSKSNVVNHFFAMLSDGKDFRSFTIPGIGIEKALYLVLQVQFNSLTPRSSFFDFASDMRTACSDYVSSQFDLPDIITGLPSGITFTSSDCDALDVAITAVGLESACGASTQMPPRSAYIFPSAANEIINVNSLSTTIINVATFLYPDDPSIPTTCLFDNDTLADATIFYNEFSKGVFCDVPAELTVGVHTNTFAQSLNGNPLLATPAWPFVVFANPVITNVSPLTGSELGGTTLTISGSGFQGFSNCYPTIDYNDDLADCLCCLFGDLSEELPIQARLVNGGNAVECTVPPKDSLFNPSDVVPVAFSMNGQIYFIDLANFTYSVQTTSGSSTTANIAATTSDAKNLGVSFFVLASSVFVVLRRTLY